MKWNFRQIPADLAKQFALNRAVTNLGMLAPTPIWFKWCNQLPDGELEFRMLWVNCAYEREFLIPMGLRIAAYLDQTDFDVHPLEVAQDYYSNDCYVRNHPDQVLHTIEPAFDGGSLYIVKSCHCVDGRYVLRGEAHRMEKVRAAVKKDGGSFCGRAPS